MQNKSAMAITVLGLVLTGFVAQGQTVSQDQGQAKDTKSSTKKVVNKKSPSTKLVGIKVAQANTPSAPKAKSVQAGVIENANNKATGLVDTGADDSAAKPGVSSPIPAARAGGKTTTSAVQPDEKKKKSKFGVKWISYNAMDVQAAENSAKEVDREVRAWEQINLNYRFTDKFSFSVMPQIWHTWFGNSARPQSPSLKSGPDNGLEQPYAGYMMNTGLKLTHTELAKYKGFVWDGQIRYDIPTSEYSQKAGEIGQTWLTTGIAKSLGKFDFKIYTIFRYYIEQYNTTTVVDAKTGLQAQLTDYRLYSLMDIGYNWSKKFSTTVETGTLNTVKHADTRPQSYRIATQTDEIATTLDFSYVVTDNLTLSTGLFETYDMRKPPTPSYTPFDVQNGGEVYLQATISI